MLDKETVQLLTSLGIDIDEKEEEKSFACTKELQEKELNITTSVEKDQQEKMDGNTSFSSSVENNKIHTLCSDEKSSIMNEKKPHIASCGTSHSIFPENRKGTEKVRSLLGPIAASCSLLISIFFVVSSCSHGDSEIRKYEKIRFSDSYSVDTLSHSKEMSIPSALKWEESMTKSERKYDPEKDDELVEYSEFLQGLHKRNIMLQNQGNALLSTLKTVQSGFHPTSLFMLHKAAQKTIRSDLISGATLSEIASNVLFPDEEDDDDNEPTLEQKLAFEALGMNQEVANEYFEITDEAEEISSMIDQTVDLLEEGGGDLQFVADTLEGGLAMLDDVESKQSDPKFSLVMTLLDVPKMKEKLFEAARFAIDAVLEDKLAEKEEVEEKESTPEISLNELKAISLLLHRLPMKGDYSRLHALESLYEAVLTPLKKQPPRKMLIESLNSLTYRDEDYAPSFLIESVIYPSENPLYTKVF